MSHLHPRWLSFVALIAAFILSAHAVAQTVVWSDDFESYAPQSVENSLGLDGAAEAPGVWSDYGGYEPFHIDATFSQSGTNSLRLDEGQATVDDAYGSDAFINLPEVYDSGSFQLTYSMFVTAAMDTYHSSVIGQTTFPIDTIWAQGVYLDQDAQAAFDAGQALLPIQSFTGEILEFVNEDVTDMVTGRWVENVINIDLDNNQWQWLHDGNVVVGYGDTPWSNSDPTLASLDFYVGFSFEGADANGVTGSVYYDDFVLTRDENTSLICDADGDGDCDHADIDALYDAFGTSGPLDLNNDGTVDTLDIGPWLTSASSSQNPFNNDDGTFVFGDVNLSGEVTSADLGLLLNNFGNADGTWDEGNLNGIDGIDSTDLGLLLNNFGFPGASAVAAVPEPGSILMGFLAIAGLLPTTRRRR